ncbi:MAG: stage II sporulation protein R [Ruminococcus sp.]|nr:stage II sporulation protein R [Ruminococcus sp.]
MKKTETAAIIGMAGALLISALGQDAAAYHSIEENVLRLHILANSDSMEDQLLKYKVRDEILRRGSVYFEDISSPEDAVYTAESSLQYLEEIAREAVAGEGYDYTVNAELVTMTFEERTYEDVTLPAGVYDAVRITIGEAEGQNWWCVMYPPLCIPAVSETEDEDEILEKYFTDEEEKLLTEPEKIRYKLKCAEWLKEIWRKVCE